MNLVGVMLISAGILVLVWTWKDPLRGTESPTVLGGNPEPQKATRKGGERP